MPFPTAAENRLPSLYHWQRFERDRLESILRCNHIYCSKPSDFNDPWDCKPYFNTELLRDTVEAQKHIEWAVRLCQSQGGMSESAIAHMRNELSNPDVLSGYITRLSHATQQAVIERYRVYCLGPDSSNVLMWAHYADSHKGICLKFGVRNHVFCGALQVQYCREFPATRQYSSSPSENLLPLVAKSDVWRYEREYRLIAQDSSNATNHDTLMATAGFLQLPAGALQAVIVGCQGDYAAVKEVVAQCKVDIPVLRARRIEHRYSLEIEE
jgi:hypothetical protein